MTMMVSRSWGCFSRRKSDFDSGMERGRCSLIGVRIELQLSDIG